MKPASNYVRETLNSMVNETFSKCMRSALRFPQQKRKLNTLANETANFQVEMMKEVQQFSNERSINSRAFLEEFNSKIEMKKREIEKRLKNLIDYHKI